MRIIFNKLTNSNSITIFLFLYGLIVQIVALPAIFYYSLAYKDSVSVFEALVFIWFCIPVVSVFSIILAIIQIKKRKSNREKYKVPLIGLILNIVWLFCYLFVLYMVFIVVKPFNL